MNLHDKPKTEEELNRLRTAVQKQVDQMTKVHIWIDCATCKKPCPIWLLYRCYYCGLLMCENCCADHFGKKRELMFDINAREAEAKKIEKGRVDKKVKAAREEKVRALLPGKTRPAEVVGGPQMGDWQGA